MKIKKQLIRFLTLYDGIWSIPATLLAFYLFGILLTGAFDFAAGTYDIGFYQPLLIGIGITIGATNSAVLGLYFFCRGLFRYLYGYRHHDGHIENDSKTDWKKLTSWQKFRLTFFVFFCFFWAVVIVYLKVV